MAGPFRLNYYLLATLIVLFLTTCASAPEIKGLFTDRTGYLDSNFSAESLQPEIRHQVSQDSSRLASPKRITITQHTEIIRNDGTTALAGVKATYFNLGHGLTKEVREISNKDIPYLLWYAISYKGFLPLKWQKVSLRRKKAYDLFEITKLHQFKPALDEENSGSIFEYTYQSRSEKNRHIRSLVKCKSDTAFEANTLHPKLRGKAISLECKLYKENFLAELRRTAYLPEYGMVLDTEITGGQGKQTFKIDDVDIGE